MRKLTGEEIYNGLRGCINDDNAIYRTSDYALWHEAEARIQQLETALREHNDACQEQCGIGDQEAVACGYRSYFEHNRRRCPMCPTHNIIDFPAQRVSKDDHGT